MTLSRKLVSAVCLALLSISCSVSNAQQVAGTATDTITSNIVTGAWNNVTPIQQPGGFSGGYTAGFIQNDNNIVFGYTQQNVNQIQAVGQALANAGTGVQVNGLLYSWQYFNEGLNRGTLSGQINLSSTSGTILQSYNYNMPRNVDGTGWVTQSGVENFVNPWQVSQLGYLGVSFVGKDDRWWAGYYGPMIRHVDVRLKYGVDPCATNPAYSSNCSGFSNVVESSNLVPYPNSYAVFGYSADNSFAINQALGAAGVGAMIHGFKWGYVANANGPYCNSWDMMFLGCWDFRSPNVTTHVNITNSSGASIYSVDRVYTNSYNTTNYSYLFPTSMPINTLGNFNFTATTNDVAYVGSMWSKAIYTPDKCTIDPLSSPTCPGYLKALGVNTTTTDTTTATTSGTTSDTTIQPSSSTPTTIAPTSSTTSGTSTAVSTESGSSSGSPTTTTSSSSGSTTAPVTVSTSTATTSVTPTANNPQPKVGEVTVAGSQAKPISSVSTSQILSIVRAEQTRIGNLETATSQQAVAQAQQASDKAASDAQKIATTQQTQSSAMSQVVAMSMGNAAQIASTPANMQQQALGSGVTIMSSMNVTSNTVGLKLPEFNISSIATQNNQSYGSLNGLNSVIMSPAAVVSYSLKSEQESVKYSEEATTNNNESKLTSGLNPLNMSMNTLPLTNSMSNALSGSSVNKEVKDNDMAGNVTLASIAKQPQGYELYMNGMQDRPFYAQKEIYRSQQVVDNAKAQRLLNVANDRLHLQMVQSQFKLGD